MSSRLKTPFVSSGPNAWMRPYYEEVASREGFARLAPSHQFALFLEAIARDYPTKAAAMREFDSVAQRATLAVFANVVYSSPPARELEFWRLAKDSCELRCVAVYLATGIDLRLMEGKDFRRTELLKDGPAVEARAEEWRAPSCARRAGRTHRLTSEGTSRVSFGARS
jgi:hypothetical protein